MRTSIKWSLGNVAAVAFLFAGGLLQPAQAVPLPSPPAPSPPTYLYLDSIAWAPGNGIGGTVLVDDWNDIVCDGAVVGTLITRVIDAPPADSDPPGTPNRRHFYWRVSAYSGAGYLRTLHVANFGLSPFDAYYRSDEPADRVKPDQVARDDHGHINYWFPEGYLTSGKQSRWFFLKTQATSHTTISPPIPFDHTFELWRNGIPGVPEHDPSLRCEIRAEGSTNPASIYIPAS